MRKANSLPIFIFVLTVLLSVIAIESKAIKGTLLRKPLLVDRDCQLIEKEEKDETTTTNKNLNAPLVVESLPLRANVPDMVFLDLENKYHDLHAILESGKFMILDLFFVGCEPCFNYYQSGKLQAIQNALGPDGTDQVRILSIETADSPLDCLDGPPGTCEDQFGSTTTYGNFLENANYPIGIDGDFESAFDVNSYPEYYFLYPDKTLISINGPTVAVIQDLIEEYYEDLNIYKNKNAQIYDLVTGLGNNYLCSTDSIAPTVSIRNLGMHDLDSILFRFYSNADTLHTYTWRGHLEPTETTQLTFPPFFFTQSKRLWIEGAMVNGVADESPANNKVSGYIYKPLLLAGKGYQSKINIKTKAERIYWELIDPDGNVIQSGGNPLVGTDGGGAFSASNPVPFHPDAYVNGVEYSDTLLAVKPGCHQLKVVDGYGEGLNDLIDGSFVRFYNFPSDNQGYRDVEGLITEAYISFDTKPGKIDIDEDGFAYEVDCDDQDGNINPDATEIPENGIDEDCDGEDLIIVEPCFANAGNDTALCITFLDGLEDYTLGGMPVVTGGVPPYTYTWSCLYDSLSLNWTASRFLNDTTLANPILDDGFWDPLTFRLDVIDSEGTSCYDSVTIRFSDWVITLDVKVRQIVQGDSVQLYISVDGGIPPITYLWSPPDGLTDPTDPFTWASPLETTEYSLLITDSIGCQRNDGFYVSVIPTAIQDEDIKKFKSKIIPNPLVQKSMIKVESPANEELSIAFYDLLGKPLKQLDLQGIETEIYRTDFNTPGIYFYQILHHGIPVSNGKLVVQ